MLLKYASIDEELMLQIEVKIADSFYITEIICSRRGVRISDFDWKVVEIWGVVSLGISHLFMDLGRLRKK